MKKIFIVLFMMILASCAPGKQVVMHDVSPIKVADVTIIQDKTTKNELLSALGAPTNMAGKSMMMWNQPANVREYFDVRYIQRDGTTFAFCVGQMNRCRKTIMVQYKLNEFGNSLDVVDSVTY